MLGAEMAGLSAAKHDLCHAYKNLNQLLAMPLSRTTAFLCGLCVVNRVVYTDWYNISGEWLPNLA